MSIEIQGITKRFGQFTALSGVSLKIESGELVALLGPSGSGKTTLLRIVAGLESPDAGVILFHGEDATFSRAHDRGVGFVFQHYALFRHMTVFENVAFGLRVRPRRTRPSEKEIGERVHGLLRLVQLDGLAKRHPAQLSGGQRQRVALARALAVEPKVLLLDEPFGALDARVRADLRRWLRNLHDEIHVTSVFVTHDQEEALEVADRVVVMNRGRVEQIGTPEEVYDHPANPFVYNFLGRVNLFHGRGHRGKATIGGVEVEAPEHAEAEDAEAVAYVRPHEIEISREPDGESMVGAVVRHIFTASATVRVQLDLDEGAKPMLAELTRARYDEIGLKRGEHVYLKARALRVFLGRGEEEITYEI
jgi:sulfate transport system ATP-binding protein